VLAGLGFFFFNLITSGRLLLYINNRFALLSFLGMIGFFMLAANALQLLRQKRQPAGEDHDHSDHEHSDHEHHYSVVNLIWLALPLAVGLLIPVRLLGADFAANKGVTLSSPLVAGRGQPAQLVEAPDQRTVLDWIRLFNNQEDLASHLGETANVIGFVYEDPRLPAGHFLVARFTVSCCVADAFAIGMAVEWPDEMVGNSWVKVRGPVDVLTVDGQQIPLIRADQVVSVSPPDQPYLFP
jgi:uncharacterized repeat protein (TIGR03943 family)